MDTIILDSYLVSLTDENCLVEGLTPASFKSIVNDIRNVKEKNVHEFLRKYSNKVKDVDEKKAEKEIEKVAEKNGLKKENVTTSKVMLKRFLGTILVGVPATVIIPISLACLIACVVRSIKNKESILDNTLSIIKEIRSGLKTTRRTNITNMEKAIITAGQATDYIWGSLSSDPMVMFKNLVGFLGMYIAAIYQFWKGIVFAGKKINENKISLSENVFVNAFVVFLGYIIFLVLVAWKLDRDNTKIMKLAKEIMPKVKNEIMKLHKEATPKVQKISRDLYQELTKLKGDDLEVLKTYGFYSWHNLPGQNKTVSELLKPLLDKKDIEKTFSLFLNNTVRTTVDKLIKEKRKVKIVTYIFNRSFFADFDLYSFDDSYDNLPEHIQPKSEKIYLKIDHIIRKHDERIIDLCKDLFRKIEKVVADHLSQRGN